MVSRGGAGIARTEAPRAGARSRPAGPWSRMEAAMEKTRNAPLLKDEQRSHALTLFFWARSAARGAQQAGKVFLRVGASSIHGPGLSTAAGPGRQAPHPRARRDCVRLGFTEGDNLAIDLRPLDRSDHRKPNSLERGRHRPP